MKKSDVNETCITETNDTLTLGNYDADNTWFTIDSSFTVITIYSKNITVIWDTSGMK